MNQELVQSETTVGVETLRRRSLAGAVCGLLDVRTPGEFSAGHVPGARNIPLDELDPAAVCRERGCATEPLYVLCQSGNRARRAIGRLESAGVKGCVLVEGGTQAWLDAGYPVERGTSRVIPLMRQVQIVVGGVTLMGSVLAVAVHPLFAVIPLVMGAGLLVAGLSGTCGLAFLLAKMPWNKSRASQSNVASCTTSIP